MSNHDAKGILVSRELKRARGAAKKAIQSRRGGQHLQIPVFPSSWPISCLQKELKVDVFEQNSSWRRRGLLSLLQGHEVENRDEFSNRDKVSEGRKKMALGLPPALLLATTVLMLIRMIGSDPSPPLLPGFSAVVSDFG